MSDSNARTLVDALKDEFDRLNGRIAGLEGKLKEANETIRILSMGDPTDKLARDALLYWKYDCSGAEPSLSVFNRMVDAALSRALPDTGTELNKMGSKLWCAQELQNALFAHPQAGAIPVSAGLIELILTALRSEYAMDTGTQAKTEAACTASGVPSASQRRQT